MGIHGCEQSAGASNVDIPVQKGLFNGFANRFEPGEMDDCDWDDRWRCC